MEEILKHETQSKSGENGGGEGMRYDECCLRIILQVSPDKETPPETIDHNVCGNGKFS